MKISTKSRYGLRLLFRLATIKTDEVVSLATIAQQEGISEKYLEHIVNRLKTAGIVRSQRGVKGGYVLAKRPEEICILDVVELLDGSLELVECVGKKACARQPLCPTQWIWERLSNVLKAELAGITLEDVVRRSVENGSHYYEI